MLRIILSQLFLFSLLQFSGSSLVAEDKAPEEAKISEVDKKANEEKEKEKLANIIKEQEKKALEIARNFFKFIKTKNTNGLKKLLSIPFIFDEEIIYTKKGIDDMIEEIDADVFPESIILQFSIDKKPTEYTDNNIVVIFKDNNTETEVESCMWIDRDSQKIIGLFAKGEKPHKNANEDEKSNPKEESTKKKLAPNQKKPEDAEEEK